MQALPVHVVAQIIEELLVLKSSLSEEEFNPSSELDEWEKVSMSESHRRQQLIAER